MLPVLLCPQICALLFTSLYILCHFIITHFKKHTDFTAGRRVSARYLPGCHGRGAEPQPPWGQHVLWGEVWGSLASPSPLGVSFPPDSAQ